MFGFFKTADDEETREPVSRRAPMHGKCKVFHREVPEGDRGIYIELPDTGDCKIYISSYGVTPGYTNKPYDKWCRETLVESYVFANLDTAKMYFRDRKSDMLDALTLATSSYADIG